MEPFTRSRATFGCSFGFFSSWPAAPAGGLVTPWRRGVRRRSSTLFEEFRVEPALVFLALRHLHRIHVRRAMHVGAKHNPPVVGRDVHVRLQPVVVPG